MTATIGTAITTITEPRPECGFQKLLLEQFRFRN